MVTLALLTAAQISNAFLKSSGAADGVSAVAIRAAAKTYSDNRLEYRELQRSVQSQRFEGYNGQQTAADAAVYEYAHIVAFRRFIFGCAPAIYAEVRSRDEFKGPGAELSWAFLSELYRASAPQIQTECNAGAISPDLISEFFSLPGVASDKSPFTNCVDELDARKRLECLWSNVTTAVGLGEVSVRYQASGAAVIATRQGGLRALDSDLVAGQGLGSASAVSAVAAWQELSNPGWDRDQDMSENPASTGSGIGAFLAQVWKIPGRMIAALVVVPVLALSAGLAMSAGAFGGGVGSVWDSLSSARDSQRIRNALEAVSKAMTRLAAQPSADSSVATAVEALRRDVSEAGGVLQSAAADNAVVRASLLTEAFLGSVSALIVWLLATGGLFVLSGGADANSANPNVLLAFALVAGLARNRVIELAFSVASAVFSRRAEAPAAS